MDFIIFFYTRGHPGKIFTKKKGRQSAVPKNIYFKIYNQQLHLLPGGKFNKLTRKTGTRGKNISMTFSHLKCQYTGLIFSQTVFNSKCYRTFRSIPGGISCFAEFLYTKKFWVGQQDLYYLVKVHRITDRSGKKDFCGD